MAAIADYIALDDLDAALRWSDGISCTFALLAKNSLLGEEASDLQHGTRRQIFGNYLIFDILAWNAAGPFQLQRD